MNPKIKKVIVREGLIILSLFGAGLLLNLLAYKLPWNVAVTRLYILLDKLVLNIEQGMVYNMESLTWVSLFNGYILYLTIRFIIWAVKTLKKKWRRRENEGK